MISVLFDTISSFPVSSCWKDTQLAQRRCEDPMGLLLGASQLKHLWTGLNEKRILLSETKYLINSYDYIDSKHNGLESILHEAHVLSLSCG